MIIPTILQDNILYYYYNNINKFNKSSIRIEKRFKLHVKSPDQLEKISYLNQKSLYILEKISCHNARKVYQSAKKLYFVGKKFDLFL